MGCKYCGHVPKKQVYVHNQLVGKLNRKELEDHYYKAWEENIALKNRINFQNNKLKILSTKLSRLHEQSKRENNILTTYCYTESYMQDKEDESYELKNEDLYNSLENKITFLEEELENLKKESLKEMVKEKHVKFFDEIIEPPVEELTQENNNIEIISTRSISVQTKIENEKTDLNIINDNLNRQLVDEQMRVLDLQRQLKKSKMTNDILHQFENHLDALKEKVKKQGMKIIEIDSTDVKQRRLEEQLLESKLNLKSLESLNREFTLKIISLQSEVDVLKLQQIKKDKGKPIKVIDDKDKKNVEKQIKNNIVSNTIKIDNLSNGIKTKNSTEKTENESTKPHTLLLRRNTYTKEDLANIKSVLKNKEEDDDKNNIEHKQNTDKTTEIVNREILSDVLTLEKPLQDNMNIAKNIETPLPIILNEDSLDCSDDYLSDGEIRSDHLTQLDNVTSSTSEFLSEIQMCKETVNESVSTTHKAKMALEVLSVEMEKCKSLMNKHTFQQNNIHLSKRNEAFNPIGSENACFYIHIESVNFNNELKEKLETKSFFLTWQFYKQHTAYTPVFNGMFLDFEFSSRYNIQIDEELIDYLLNESIVIEIHKTIGVASECFAKCTLDLKGTLLSANRKVHFVQKIVKCNIDTSSEPNKDCGEIHCWCQLNCDTNLVKKIKSNLIFACESYEN